MSEATERVLELAKGLAGHELNELLVALGHKPLTVKQELFVHDYAAHGDKRAAQQRAEVKHPWQGALADTEPKARPNVQAAIDIKLKEHAARSELTADYVREYIHSVLELCPTDFFEYEDGDWYVDPQKWVQLPQQVRRLVESVEQKVSREGVRFRVYFVSKAVALGLAAKFTLVQKVAVQASIFDQLAQANDAPPVDVVDRRLADELARIPRPVQTSEAPLAGQELLQQGTRDSDVGVGQPDDGGPSGSQDGEGLHGGVHLCGVPAD